VKFWWTSYIDTTAMVTVTVCIISFVLLCRLFFIFLLSMVVSCKA